MARLLALATLAALVLAAAAAAATPAQYRAKVNGICRGYTPTFKKLEAKMAAAQKSGDNQSYAVALGQLLVNGLMQDTKVEAVPIPSALRARMRPLIAQLKLVDARIRAAVLAAANGDQAQFATNLAAIQKIAPTLNAKFDAAGLRDCGSNQT